MNKYFSGGLAGLVATAPMTLVMLLLHERLPRREKHPLPPEEITRDVASHTGIGKHWSQPQQQVATWIAHFGFGAGAGLVYAPLADKVPAPPALKGAVFGLLVWAASYLGWLPESGILNQPKEQPARPNALMIVAHLVWGAALGLLTERGLATTSR